jgi:hypothetical protein
MRRGGRNGSEDGVMLADYTARIVDVPGRGIRLEPAGGSAVPDQPNDVDLLAIGIAFALGAAGYEHHPEPRDPEAQTLEGLLAGTAVMPWRRAAAGAGPGTADPGTEPHVICGQAASGMFTCTVRYLPASTPQAGSGGL